MSTLFAGTVCLSDVPWYQPVNGWTFYLFFFLLETFIDRCGEIFISMHIHP